MRPNDPVPTSEPSICARRLSDDENDKDVSFKYGSSNGGLRQSKRLRQGKSRKQKKQILVWKHTNVGDIKLKVRTVVPGHVFTFIELLFFVSDTRGARHTRALSDPVLSWWRAR
jgi:hypothetical protein